MIAKRIRREVSFHSAKVNFRNFLTFLVLRFMTGPEVGVMVTDGVMDKFEDERPSRTCLPWMKGARDEVPVVRVAPPGSDCLGNGKHCAWLSFIDDCLKCTREIRVAHDKVDVYVTYLDIDDELL
jgi:hypothetical protein